MSDEPSSSEIATTALDPADRRRALPLDLRPARPSAFTARDVTVDVPAQYPPLYCSPVLRAIGDLPSGAASRTHSGTSALSRSSPNTLTLAAQLGPQEPGQLGRSGRLTAAHEATKPLHFFYTTTSGRPVRNGMLRECSGTKVQLSANFRDAVV